MVKVLPLAAMGRIMKKAGANRISDSAKKALADVLEELGTNVSEKAWKFAQHAGRTTIKSEDIILAKKEM